MPFFRDLVAVAMELADASRWAFGERVAAAGHDALHVAASAGRDAKRRRGGLRRIAALWRPRGPGLVLSAVRTFTDDAQAGVETTGEGIFNAIRKHWAPVFTAPIGDLAVARRLLAQHAVPWDCEFAAPLAQDFERRLRRAPNSAPGLDGLGYEAWPAGGALAAETLSGNFGHLSAGGDVPHDFNEALLAVLPEGSQPDDTQALVSCVTLRRPDCWR